ncbi:MAG TPA: BON domain-containing protein, partial [Vicinamibacteria bacterium]|nr:BON domain-containing protein [Vicinamibacteria bacterium]
MDSEEDTKAAGRGGWRVTLGVLVLILAGAVGVALWQGVDLGRTFQEARKTTEEAATTARVKAAFMLSNRVSAFDIDVDTEGGVVTLRGQVPANEIRELAEAIAEDVASRAEIRNELDVVPGVRPDSELEELRRRVGELEIETSVMAALAKHPRLREKNIRGDVTGDRVTLEGSVDHAEDKLGAERLAQATEGVHSVVNNIVVEESRQRMDD